MGFARELRTPHLGAARGDEGDCRRRIELRYEDEERGSALAWSSRGARRGVVRRREDAFVAEVCARGEERAEPIGLGGEGAPDRRQCRGAGFITPAERRERFGGCFGGRESLGGRLAILAFTRDS